MQFNLETIKKILLNTPEVLKALLTEIPEELLNENEGGDSWSPVKIVGHLIGGEKTDWIPRAKIILEKGADATFEPFDMEFQDRYTPGKDMDELLEEFEILRDKNLQELEKLNLQEEDFNKGAKHPALGDVTMKELLTTWAVHDLGHIAQISRVIAKQYKNQIGPWANSLRIVK